MSVPEDHPVPPFQPGAPSAGLAAELRELQERFHALVDGHFDGLVVSVGGIVVEANQTLAEMLGTTVAELVGKTPEAHVVQAATVHENIESGSALPYRVDMRRRDGSVFPVELQGRNAHYRGQPARITAIRDISARLAAQRLVTEGDARFRELTDLLPVAVAETDLTGHIVFLNRAGLKLAGVASVEAARHLRVHDLMADSDAAQMAANFGRRVSDQPVAAVEYMCKRADGTVFPGIVYSTMYIRDGKPAGVRAVVTDISAQREAEQQRIKLEARMQDAQHMESLGVLAGGVAHDFNNLLLSMLGNLDLALEDLPADSAPRRHLQHARTAALRAATLTQQLLDYSGKGHFVVEDVDVNALTSEIAALLGVTFPKNVQLHLDLAQKLPTVRADATQLRQVIMNLLTNGAESMREHGGTLRVTTEIRTLDAAWLQDCRGCEQARPGPHVVLSVEDRGVGMDAATQARIFEPFFTTKAVGRGLGLSSVLGIVRRCGGAVRVKSTVGQGSTFTVALPCAG